MRKFATYIIYYTDKNGETGGYTVDGTQAFYEALKWLHSDEVKATRIEIYKAGKDFANNQDDVLEVYKRYWK